MKTNDVTLFSNGIGHFRRVYKIPKGGMNFSIPFKRDHIGDVAASLQVFGRVKFSKTPSFTPSNSNSTSLKIDQENAMRSLISNLSGAIVEVALNGAAKGHQYTLLGGEKIPVFQNGSKIEEDYICLLSKDNNIVRKRLSEVTGLIFVQDSVKTEIAKALMNNFQKIKPDSTLLDLSLDRLGDLSDDVEAVVQYTIPVASWKMRYAIRQEKETFTLEGAAIIDNNTDEDWDNFQVSVVTGNPISFATDIANVSMPTRKFVRLVDDNSLSNVSVEEGVALEGFRARNVAAVCASGGVMRSMSMSPKMSTATYSNFGAESAEEEMIDLNENYLAAESAGVDTKEVGDFSIFTHKEPITILARKSSVVPMFNVPLTKAGVVLLYKEGNHPRRPYRAIKFKNETTFSLGKGKTLIYNSGVFSGECILETAKPGENRMLPHCLENGVKIVKESKPVQQQRSSIRISDGIGITEDAQTAITTYTVENKKDEVFKVALEHINSLRNQANLQIDFEGVEIKEKEKLPTSDGYRVYFELEPNQSVTLTVTEFSLVSSRSVIGNYFGWVKSVVVDTKNPLSQDPQILTVISVQEQIDDLNITIQTMQDTAQDLSEQAERVRSNIESTSAQSNNSTVELWIQDLDTTEKEIRKINKVEIPEEQKKLKLLNAKLTDEIKKISVIWKQADKAEKPSQLNQ